MGGIRAGRGTIAASFVWDEVNELTYVGAGVPNINVPAGVDFPMTSATISFRSAANTSQIWGNAAVDQDFFIYRRLGDINHYIHFSRATGHSWYSVAAGSQHIVIVGGATILNVNNTDIICARLTRPDNNATRDLGTLAVAWRSLFWTGQQILTANTPDAIDLSAIAAGNPNIAITPTSNTPVDGVNVNAWMEITDTVAGVSKFIPLYL